MNVTFRDLMPSTFVVVFVCFYYFSELYSSMWAHYHVATDIHVYRVPYGY